MEKQKLTKKEMEEIENFFNEKLWEDIKFSHFNPSNPEEYQEWYLAGYEDPQVNLEWVERFVDVPEVEDYENLPQKVEAIDDYIGEYLKSDRFLNEIKKVFKFKKKQKEEKMKVTIKGDPISPETIREMAVGKYCQNDGRLAAAYRGGGLQGNLGYTKIIWDTKEGVKVVMILHGNDYVAWLPDEEPPSRLLKWDEKVVQEEFLSEPWTRSRVRTREELKSLPMPDVTWALGEYEV